MNGARTCYSCGAPGHFARDCGNGGRAARCTPGRGRVNIGNPSVTDVKCVRRGGRRFATIGHFTKEGPKKTDAIRGVLDMAGAKTLLPPKWTKDVDRTSASSSIQIDGEMQGVAILERHYGCVAREQNCFLELFDDTHDADTYGRRLLKVRREVIATAVQDLNAKFPQLYFESRGSVLDVDHFDSGVQMDFFGIMKPRACIPVAKRADNMLLKDRFAMVDLSALDSNSDCDDKDSIHNHDDWIPVLGEICGGHSTFKKLVPDKLCQLELRAHIYRQYLVSEGMENPPAPHLAIVLPQAAEKQVLVFLKMFQEMFPAVISALDEYRFAVLFMEDVAYTRVKASLESTGCAGKGQLGLHRAHGGSRRSRCCGGLLFPHFYGVFAVFTL